MKPITEKEFFDLVEFVKKTCGVNLHQKKTLVTGRLQNYLSENNFDSFADYLDHVISDKTGKAAAVLINKLTTNHTFFMREPRHFEIFKYEVLPFLEKSQQDKKDLSIWSAGCSTGEEPYTLAMIIADYFGANKFSWDTRLLATDISTQALDTAINGIYRKENADLLPEKWKKHYFKETPDGNYKISEKIGSEIIFRKFNLMTEQFPFKKRFNVIFCRNVMIYFDSETKRKLVDKFYEYTEEGGYLFIGHSESLDRDKTRYRYVMPAVFRK